jgi:hypothetical protein
MDRSRHGPSRNGQVSPPVKCATRRARKKAPGAAAGVATTDIAARQYVTGRLEREGGII